MRKITKRVVSLLSVLTVGGGIVGNTLLSFPEPDKSYTVKAETTNTTASSMLDYDDSNVYVVLFLSSADD